MVVFVNKSPISIPQKITVIEFLQYIDSPRAVAIFINEQQILFSQYDEYVLEENDNIRLIRPIGGG